MRQVLWLIAASTIWCSCAVFKGKNERFARRLVTDIEHSPVFTQSHTGFTLLDPTTGLTLADVRGDHYFIPASNIKIFTLATCLDLLGDSIAALRYFQKDSFLVFQGVADPTFLHPYFQDFRHSFDFLAQSRLSLLLRETRILEPRFGPGWAWDDYTEAYQPEKTIFPIYGNTLKVTGVETGRKFKVDPIFFRTVVEYPYYDYEFPIKPDIGRREFDNMVGMRRLPALGEEIVIPFRQPYFQGMLGDTLGVQNIDVARNHFDFSENWHWTTLYSTPRDTVLRRMMYQSDNFIAEQLLLVCAGQRFDLFRQDTLIRWMLDAKWADMPQKPRWVDGSGLSRYNLATPQSLVFLLQKMWNEQPNKTLLLSYFPAGGVSGTLQNFYVSPEGSQPYVFAKTGGMSGVYCLSGYLACKSGKVLIFSFMHNNFVGSSSPWKAEMERLLRSIYERY